MRTIEIVIIDKTNTISFSGSRVLRTSRIEAAAFCQSAPDRNTTFIAKSHQPRGSFPSEFKQACFAAPENMEPQKKTQHVSSLLKCPISFCSCGIKTLLSCHFSGAPRHKKPPIREVQRYNSCPTKRIRAPEQ